MRMVLALALILVAHSHAHPQPPVEVRRIDCPNPPNTRIGYSNAWAGDRLLVPVETATPPSKLVGLLVVRMDRDVAEYQPLAFEAPAFEPGADSKWRIESSGMRYGAPVVDGFLDLVCMTNEGVGAFAATLSADASVVALRELPAPHGLRMDWMGLGAIHRVNPAGRLVVDAYVCPLDAPDSETDWDWCWEASVVDITEGAAPTSVVIGKYEVAAYPDLAMSSDRTRIAYFADSRIVIAGLASGAARVESSSALHPDELPDWVCFLADGLGQDQLVFGTTLGHTTKTIRHLGLDLQEIRAHRMPEGTSLAPVGQMGSHAFFGVGFSNLGEHGPETGSIKWILVGPDLPPDGLELPRLEKLPFGGRVDPIDKRILLFVAAP